MNLQYFIANTHVRASARWREAFTGSEEIAMADSAARTGIFWLSTQRSDWQSLLYQLSNSLPPQPVIVLSPTPDDTEGLLALEGGARGYIHLHAVPTLLREVALAVQHGGLWIGPDLMQRMMAITRKALPTIQMRLPAILSAREAQVARTVADGFSNRETAEKLGISERTVKAHLGAAFEKLGVRDRLQLVIKMSTPDNKLEE
jgi:two-component system nitrate/nitrite response regulator NarL